MVMEGWPPNVSLRSDSGTFALAGRAKSNMRRTDHERARAERREPHTHLIASDTGAHDLAQCLIVETSIRQARRPRRRLVHGGAPAPDPMCFTADPAKAAGEYRNGECSQRQRDGRQPPTVPNRGSLSFMTHPS